MKKIINGKMYNTETATELGDFWNGLSTSDFRNLSETLYRKKNGEFFLYGQGGAMTEYSLDEDGCINGSIIEAHPAFTVMDQRDKTHGHYTRFDEAQAMVDKLWNISYVDAFIDVKTEFKD